jgi:carbonic anhydrase
MRSLLQPPKEGELPAVRRWLEHAETTRQVVKLKYQGRSDEQLLNVTVQENVLAQLESLRTHPSVAARLADGSLRMHGWVYKIETGEVFSYDPAEGQFRALGQNNRHAASTGSPRHALRAT